MVSALASANYTADQGSTLEPGKVLLGLRINWRREGYFRCLASIQNLLPTGELASGCVAIVAAPNPGQWTSHS